MMTPLILDELLGGRNISRFLAYVAMIIVRDTFLSLLGSTTDVVMEKNSEKMSLRVMELDLQLTENKKALNQNEKQ